jgi:hypothetical protein
MVQWYCALPMDVRLMSTNKIGFIRGQNMQEKRERWMELVAMVADEQDPEKLSELVKEIDQLLAEKQDRLNRLHLPSKPSE